MSLINSDGTRDSGRDAVFLLLRFFTCVQLENSGGWHLVRYSFAYHLILNVGVKKCLVFMV